MIETVSRLRTHRAGTRCTRCMAPLFLGRTGSYRRGRSLEHSAMRQCLRGTEGDRLGPATLHGSPTPRSTSTSCDRVCAPDSSSSKARSRSPAGGQGKNLSRVSSPALRRARGRPRCGSRPPRLRSGRPSRAARLRPTATPRCEGAAAPARPSRRNPRSRRRSEGSRVAAQPRTAPVLTS